MENIASSEFQLIAIEEAGEIPEYGFQFLPSRLRQTINQDYKLKVRLASNPWDNWLKREFIDLTPEEMQEKGRVFVPASYLDNPYINNEEYELSLSNLDYRTYLCLAKGVWDIVNTEGLLVNLDDLERNTVNSYSLEDIHNRFNIFSVDTADEGADDTVAMVVSFDRGNDTAIILDGRKFESRYSLDEQLSDYLVSVHRHYNIRYIVKEAAMGAEHVTSFDYWKNVFVKFGFSS